MLTLFIDSSKIDEIIIKLTGDFGEEVLITKTKNIRGSQVILSSIQQILEKKGKTLKDITAIELYEGTGSYTGLRVGASIANTLAYSLGISLNGKTDKFVYPTYE